MRIRNINLGAWIINKGYNYTIKNSKLDVDISKTDLTPLIDEYNTTDHKDCQLIINEIIKLIKES